jgi:hypothetical protein
MANTVANVVVGKPKATGGVYAGPLGTALPTDTTTALNASFLGLGYVGEDGLTMTKGGDVTTIRAWGGDSVKVVKATDDLSFNWTFIESSDQVMEEIFGADNVSVGVSDTTIQVNGQQVGPREWVFEIVDGDFAIRIVCPNAELSGEVSVTFVDGQAVAWPATITCLPDASGNKAYIYKTADA